MGDKRDFCSAIYRAFKSRKVKKLRKLKNKILKKAVLYFTKEFFDLATYSYVLAKIASKSYLLDHSDWIESIEIDLIHLIDVSDGSLREWNGSIRSLKQTITSLEKEDSRYIMSLIKKGELKAAATLYAQGISLGLASSVTGMDKQDILDYSGKTMMFDRLKEEIDIFDRVKYARKLIDD